MPTPEVPEVYVTSLDTLDNDYRTDNKKWVEMFSQNKQKLLNDINRMRQNTYFSKVNVIDKRARMVRNHAYVMMKLKKRKNEVTF